MSFVGSLIVFDKKGELAVPSELRLVEVTEAGSDGVVEISYPDRGAQHYLRFKLGDLVQQTLEATSD